MKITSQIVSIPPYISTSWKNIVSFHTKGDSSEQIVIVELKSGDKVFIPDLKQEEITTLFLAHAKFLEESLQEPAKEIKAAAFSPPFPLPFLFPNFEGFSALIQHDIDKKDHPNLPPELMEKLVPILQTLISEEPNLLSPSEPDCNCPHCQIMEHVLGSTDAFIEEDDDVVSLEELKFRVWDIEEKTPRLYNVKNPSDAKEEYTVFLGTPLGCTCGFSGCEHIQAVLKS
ncbi:hypothetical protein [Rhabdochlamydiaceae symbiont of Dictyostelium giganteum]|uniref:hypothetical protein n=1 Tax=Rhabdochlamydiaceae symbiont of Dictyostelium giganteum TaxID=3342349 RepID=UPI0038516522